MNIKVDNTEKNYIFKPATAKEEIMQNVENVVSRIKYNIPLAREKGIIAENIDKPQEVAKAELVADISDEIDREEPRYKVSEVTISDTYIEKGQMSADIKGVILDE